MRVKQLMHEISFHEFTVTHNRYATKRRTNPEQIALVERRDARRGRRGEL